MTDDIERNWANKSLRGVSVVVRRSMPIFISAPRAGSQALTIQSNMLRPTHQTCSGAERTGVGWGGIVFKFQLK